LLPILERETMKGLGKWRFVKFDIDSLPSLTSALEVKRVPTVFLINRGKVIHKIEGVPDEPQLKALLGDVQILSGLGTDEDIVTVLLQAAEELLLAKDWDKALGAFSECLSHPKWSAKYGLVCQLGLAQAYFGRGDLQRTQEILQSLNDVEENSTFKELVKALSTAEAPGEYVEQLNTVSAALVEDPLNLQALLRQAALYYKLKRPREAVDAALKAIEAEGCFKGEGHAVLMEVFESLPPSDSLVQEGRRRLQKLYGQFH
jgi:thioredoxin-like negative regulator of GroEL